MNIFTIKKTNNNKKNNFMNDSMIELIRCCLLQNIISSNDFMCLTVLEFSPSLRLHDTPDQNSKDQRLTRTTIY